MEVDDDVEDLSRLDRARVLIKTSWRPALQHVVNLHIAKEIHQVFIVEETGHDKYPCRCQPRQNASSSEEVESEESEAGDDLQTNLEANDADLATVGPDGNTNEGGTGSGPQQLQFLPKGHYGDPRDINQGVREGSANPNDLVASDLEAKNGKESALQTFEETEPGYVNVERRKAPSEARLVTVDHPFCPPPLAAVDLGGVDQRLSSGSSIMLTGTKHSNFVPAGVDTACDKGICEDHFGQHMDTGPPLLGLTNPTSPAASQKTYMSPLHHNGASTSTLKVY